MTYSKTDLVVSPESDGKTWKLVWEFKVTIDGFSIDTIKIPAGFTFDFASIPRFLWWLMPPATGKYRIPAAVHDYLYREAFTTRKEADDIFLYLMEKEQVKAWKRYLMYAGVRLFGGKFYD